MTQQTLLTVIAYVAGLLVVGVAISIPIVAWAKREADTRPVDEGQSFGGEYHD